MHRLIFLMWLAACGGVAGPKFTGNVRVADSRLVAVNPDVKTFADVDQPVFFARGHLWLFHDGRWFRAQRASGPWTYDAEPPVPVRQIEQPFAYVHYKHDQPGTEIETVAVGPQTGEADDASDRPPTDRPAPGVDPSVDPTINP